MRGFALTLTLLAEFEEVRRAVGKREGKGERRKGKKRNKA